MEQPALEGPSSTASAEATLPATGTTSAPSTISSSTSTTSAHALPGVRLVVVDLETLRALLRELLSEMLRAPALPEYYSQACLPPGMTRRTFLEAIRRGDLPARASGKSRLVARSDFQAFIRSAPAVRVRVDKQPTPANDVRAIVRNAQGRR